MILWERMAADSGTGGGLFAGGLLWGLGTSDGVLFGTGFLSKTVEMGLGSGSVLIFGAGVCLGWGCGWTGGYEERGSVVIYRWN